MKDDYLYIFLHTPKTAGSTMRYHIRKNLKLPESLLLSHTALGLEKYPPKYYETLYKNIDGFMGGMPEKKKNKIKIIYGHFVPYGIHKYFSRPVRYFTFLRDPVKRTLSAYKHQVRSHQSPDEPEHIKERIKKSLIINGKIPEFSDWVSKKYDKNNWYSVKSVRDHLINLKYLKKGKLTAQKLEDLFDKFYFVGTTKNYSEESLFIYSLLGFSKFYSDKNVSKRYIKLNKKEIALTKRANTDDYKIFEYAQKVNANFKKNNKKYRATVEKMQKKANIIRPVLAVVTIPKRLIKKLDDVFLGQKLGHTLYLIKKAIYS